MFSDFHSEIFSWIRGALFVLFIINISVYFQNKKRLFLNYSLYLFFVFLYFFKPVAPAWCQPMYRNSFELLDFEPMIFTYLGVLLEALVFTYIMGRIFKQIIEKKTDLKLQYLLKQKETAELKMTALQSQMNPHFLFNSLNSINNYVLKNDKEQASDYISSFSRLIRTVLKNSERMHISLLEELDVLKMYVNVEQKRIKGGFAFSVTIDDELCLTEINVPPLFLQPYIENSIWHGLARKKGEKKVELKLTKEKDTIHIAIEDNGVGLKKALEEKSQIASRRKSFGASATEKRIYLMFGEENVTIDIQDTTSDTSSGTLVLIKFPIKA